MQWIQMQLTQKQTTFSEFSFTFWKFILNFKHFPKTDNPHSWCIFGNTGYENHG